MKTLEEAKVAKGCLYIQMPVHEVRGPQSFFDILIFRHDCGQYGTLQYSKFEEIQQKGYKAALEILRKFDEADRLPSAFVDGKEATDSGKKKGRSARRNSV